MNKKMLRKRTTAFFEIEPPARSLSPNGLFLGTPHRLWQLTEEQGKFKIRDTSSQHFVYLNGDTFQGLREPNVLQMKVQLTRQGNHCWEDPKGFNRTIPLPAYATVQSNPTGPSEFEKGLFWGVVGTVLFLAVANA